MQEGTMSPGVGVFQKLEEAKKWIPSWCLQKEHSSADA